MFTERFEQETVPYARRLQRVSQVLIALVCIGAGNSSPILSTPLGISVSPSTLLQLIARPPIPIAETARVLGVDDWAFRKG